MSRVFFVIVPMVDLIERNSSKSTNNSIRMAKLTISASTFRLVRGDRNRLNGGDLFFSRLAFDTFDSNNDGTIDFDEFLLAISATSQGDLDQRLSVAFDM